MKSLLTVKWVTKFVTSLVALNPELKKGIKLKESGDWNAYKPFVDAALYKWLNPLMDMGNDLCARYLVRCSARYAWDGFGDISDSGGCADASYTYGKTAY